MASPYRPHDTQPLIAHAVDTAFAGYKLARDVYDDNKQRQRTSEKPVGDFHEAFVNLGEALTYYNKYSRNNPRYNLEELRSEFLTVTRQGHHGHTGRYRNMDLYCTAFLCLAMVNALINPEDRSISDGNIRSARRIDRERVKTFLETELIEFPRPVSHVWRNSIIGVVLLIVLVIAGFTTGLIPKLVSSQSPQVSSTPSSNRGITVTPNRGITVTPTAARSQPEPPLKVPFAKGTNGVTTRQSYKGTITITVTGEANAGGVGFGDAFYFYNPLTSPQYNTNYGLYINGKPINEFVHSLPRYRADHKYTFTISAPGGPLTFGVGKALAQDPNGFFTITISSV